MTERKLCCKSHRKRILAGQLQAGRDYSKSTKKITKTIYKESKKKTKGEETYSIHIKTSTQVFIAALLKRVQRQKQ